MTYSIFARTLLSAQELAHEKGWSPKEWCLYILDIDEPFARLRGVNAEA